MRFRLFPLAAALVILSASSSQAAPLTIESCLATAMANNPDLVAARENVNAEITTINQAAAPGRPQLSAGSSYRRSGSGDDHSGLYDTSVGVEQSISDWGRREINIKRAGFSAAAAEGEYNETLDTVIQSVYSAYYSLNRAVRDREIAQTRFDNYAKRLDWARSYYEVGTKAKIEVTNAESDLATSKLSLVRAQSTIEQCRAELASAMGVPLMKITDVVDILGYEEWNIGLDEAVSNALRQRPKLIAEQIQVESAAENVALQMKGLSPSLSASAGYAFGDASYFDSDEWYAQLSLSIPLTDGGLTKSKVEQARAQLRQAEAELASLENSVTLEVRTAWENLRQAKESLTAASEAERAAKATLDLALGRYQAGVGDNLEISDAVESYASASGDTVLALYDCKNARLDLEKAMGGLNHGE